MTEDTSIYILSRALSLRTDHSLSQLRGDVPLDVGPQVSTLQEEAAIAEAEPRVLEQQTGADAE